MPGILISASDSEVRNKQHKTRAPIDERAEWFSFDKQTRWFISLKYEPWITRVQPNTPDVWPKRTKKVRWGISVTIQLYNNSQTIAIRKLLRSMPLHTKSTEKLYSEGDSRRGVRSCNNKDNVIECMRDHCKVSLYSLFVEIKILWTLGTVFCSHLH